MTVHAKLAPELQLTIEEFLAFTDSRPNGEKWELIEGAAVMNPSPTDFHQYIVSDILAFLLNEQRRLGASWNPTVGIGTVVPAFGNSLPQPDLMVKAEAGKDSATTEEALVLFEVLSKSNTKSDQAWRRKAYSSVPNCQHYVTVSTRAVEMVVYDRSTAWKPRTVSGLNNACELPALAVTIPLAEAYRRTQFGAEA